MGAIKQQMLAELPTDAEVALANAPDRPRLPFSVVIGHLTYTVSRDQQYLDLNGAKNNCEYAGYSRQSEQRLILADGLPAEYEAETLLHEVLHQCLRVTGCDPDEDATAGVKDVEERAVRAMAGPLYAALRHNPALVAYLVGDAGVEQHGGNTPPAH